MKGFSAAAVDEALERLQQERLLDDRRFAEHFTEQALESHRFAGQRLCQELRRRGVNGDIVASVTAAGRETHDESEGVAALLERRFPAFRWQASDEREKRRIISFLQRRGYAMNVILQVMRSTA